MKTRKNLIKEIKENFKWYRYRGKQGLIINTCTAHYASEETKNRWEDKQGTQDFFFFSDMSIEQLQDCIDFKLPNCSYDEVYCPFYDEKGMNVTNMAVPNYENEQCLVHYEFSLSREAYIRRRTWEVEAKNNKYYRR